MRSNHPSIHSNHACGKKKVGKTEQREDGKITDSLLRKRGGGGGCTRYSISMHDRSRMTIHPRIITMPGRSMSCFHRTGRHCLHRGGGGGGKRIKKNEHSFPDLPLPPSTCRAARKITHSQGSISELIFSEAKGGHITKTAALGRYRQDHSMGASLGVCSFPVVEETSFGVRPSGCVILLVVMRHSFPINTMVGTTIRNGATAPG